MTFEEFTSDLPRDRTMKFESAEENQEYLERRGVKEVTRQLGKGACRIYRVAASSPHGDFHVSRFSTAMLVHLQGPPGMVGLLLPRSAGGEVRASGELANSRLIVIPDGTGTDLITPDLMAAEALVIPASLFEALTQTLCPTVSAPRVTTAIEGDMAELCKLCREIQRIVCDPASDPTGNCAAEVVEGLVAWMGHSASTWQPEGLSVFAAHIRVARRARDYIEDSYREPIRMSNLCRVTGIGVRTLQRAFLEFFGITITEYLNAVRLDAARRALTRAHPSQETVTSIALRSGFTHVGRFAVQYRKHFRESPKETLMV